MIDLFIAKHMVQKVALPFIKRCFDIGISIFLLAIFSPFLLLLLFFIGFEQLLFSQSRGPLLYSETRVSGGQPFQFYKIRIFKQSVIDRERKLGRVVHTKPLEQNPENLTYYGRFLKKIYFDELAQFFNVLKGEMTLVGPRPTNIENSERLKQAGDYTKERMLCGITGPFQSEKGSGANQSAVDSAYIDFVMTQRGWKLVAKDFRILCRTVKTVFQARGI